MSCFTTPAIFEMLAHYNWHVHESFAFYLSDDDVSGWGDSDWCPGEE